MSPEVQALFDAAATVMSRAYAPYSRFPVGAAIRSTTGVIYAGCNVENAAYPEGVCAETGAISAMAAAGERRIRAIVVVGDGTDLCTPCGGCRQRIREFADAATVVHVGDATGLRAAFTLDDLLPRSFGPDNLAPAQGSTS